MSRNVRGFAHRTGAMFEGELCQDEEEAVHAVSAVNYIYYMEKSEAREAAKKAKIKSKITLPKLKFMGQL